jgi:hypothetical protein
VNAGERDIGSSLSSLGAGMQVGGWGVVAIPVGAAMGSGVVVVVVGTLFFPCFFGSFQVHCGQGQ